MDKWYSRFRRGDVWFLHFDTENGDGIYDSSVQKKSRPYVIVSCEENNLNAPTFNVIPITSRNNDHLPMHVYYRYEDGTDNARNQLILCEQVTTASILTFNHQRSFFMYSLNIELMNQVDEALARQLGLKPRVADMSVLERIVANLAEQQKAQLEAEKEREVALRVEKLAEMLAKKFSLNLTSADLLNGTEYRDSELQLADKAVVQEMRATATERKQETPVAKPSNVTTPGSAFEHLKTPVRPNPKPTAEVEAIPAKPSDSGRYDKPRKHKWSEDDKRTFLDDYKKMSITEMAEKYGLKKSTVATNASIFKKELMG